MPITIGNIHNVKTLSDQHDYIISILDPSMLRKQFHNFGQKHLIVYFEDTEHPDEKERAYMHAGIEAILAWAQRKKLTKDDEILVHCHAGVSRSSAVAWLLMVYFGIDQKTAFQDLIVRFPNIWPNTEVMSIGDTFLNKKGELYKLACRVNAEISETKKSYLGYGG